MFNKGEVAKEIATVLNETTDPQVREGYIAEDETKILPILEKALKGQLDERFVQISTVTVSDIMTGQMIDIIYALDIRGRCWKKIARHGWKLCMNLEYDDGV